MSSGAAVTWGTSSGSSGSSGSPVGWADGRSSAVPSPVPSPAERVGDWPSTSFCQPVRPLSSSGRLPSSARRAAETKAGLSARVRKVSAAAPMSAVRESTHTVTVVRKRATPLRSSLVHRPCPFSMAHPVLSFVSWRVYAPPPPPMSPGKRREIL